MILEGANVQAVLKTHFDKPGGFWQCIVFLLCTPPPAPDDPESIRSWLQSSSLVRGIAAKIAEGAATTYAFGRGGSVTPVGALSEQEDEGLLLLPGEEGAAPSVVQRTTPMGFMAADWWPPRASASGSAVFLDEGGGHWQAELERAFRTRNAWQLTDLLFRARFEETRLRQIVAASQLYVYAGANWSYAPACHFFLPAETSLSRARAIFADHLEAAGVEAYEEGLTAVFRYVVTNKRLPPDVRPLR